MGDGNKEECEDQDRRNKSKIEHVGQPCVKHIDNRDDFDKTGEDLVMRTCTMEVSEHR